IDGANFEPAGCRHGTGHHPIPIRERRLSSGVAGCEPGFWTRTYEFYQMMEHPLTLTGTRFGDIEYNDADAITFEEGLIGFGFANRFILVNVRDDSPFRWLQCVTEPALA